MLGLKRLQCPTTLSVRYILSAALILSVFLFNTHAMADTTNTMLGRSSIERSYISLSADDWDWLRKKRVLELGVPQPDFPPFEMTAHSAYYEGITADVAGMLSQLLNIEVKVSVMPDRTSALVALERGSIDMIGSANCFETAGGRVLLSNPYAEDVPAIYVNLADKSTLSKDLVGKRVAVSEGYLQPALLKARYPKALIQYYKSPDLALAALAFGDADAYIGDAISSNYLINISYFNYVRLDSLLDITTGGFGFAIKEHNTRLASILNQAIKVIRDNRYPEIIRRWSGGGGALSTEKIKFTPAEARWLERNPTVRYVVNGDLAPIAYFDENGNFSGVTSDLMRNIQMRTGMRFKVVRTESFESMVKMIEGGDADMTVLTSTIGREDSLRFTRPFIYSTFSIITRKVSNAPTSLESLKGKRVAVPRGHAALELLAGTGGIEVVPVSTIMEALSLVANGKADATITTLGVAQYYILHLYEKELKVSNIIGNAKGSLAFASRRGDTELNSILEKVLLSIPPEDIDVILNRWRVSVGSSSASWRDYRQLIYQVGGVVFVLILASVLWNVYIRRQYRQKQLVERALSDQLKFMGTLINGTPHPIYVRDLEGRLVTCNDNYLDTFGVTSADVIGKTSLEGAKLNRQEALQFHDDYLRVMEQDVAYEVDRVLHIGERVLSIYHWIQPYHASSGEIRGVICGWVDISERRELMEELRAARDLADESSRAKTTFLATMSHEIRTPMSAVIGMLELAMKRADQGHFDRPAIEVAYDSARGLLELIGDILDVVRIESGHVSLAPKRANLRELVESVTRVFDGLARQRSLRLTLDIDSTVNCDVFVDPLRFKQVLSNLVGNAIKFTDRGEVKVSVRGQEVDDERLHVCITVEDTGIGISSEDQALLFQPFAQVNHGRTSRGGTGLGLTICQSLCALMGGGVSIRSTLGKGTSVDVELYLAIMPALLKTAPKPLETVTTKRPLFKVLVVDDQPANRLLLCQQLGFLDQVVEQAENGEEGLKLWREGHFDVVFSDCNMPIMNGYDMARAIRKDEAERGSQRCVIIGYTANAQPEERTKCLAAGMDDCLFKPVSLTSLSGALQAISVQGPVPVTEPVLMPQRLEYSMVEERLRDLTGGDEAAMEALVREAYNSYTKDLAALQSAIGENDAQVLSELAHRIKGAARIVNAISVIGACNRLEEACHADLIEPIQMELLALTLQTELEALIVVIKQLYGRAGD